MLIHHHNRDVATMSNRGTLFALITTLVGAHACAATLPACADQAEMPPFVYAERIDGRKSEHIMGASVDLLRLVGQGNGWDVQVQLLPWARCLALVGSGQMALAINVSAQDADVAGLAVSVPYYTLHQMYFYSRRARPQGLDLKRLDALSQYHVCGLGGYRFEDYGIATASVDRGTTLGYEQLISKLHLGRCDLFISSRETMAGQYLVNPTLRGMLVDGTLAARPLPGRPTRALYFGVSRAHGAKLLDTLDKGLLELERGRKIDVLLDHYLQ
jgi:polar amino acid transport system substrate-binding protein